MRDILSQDDTQIAAVLEILDAVAPDLLVLTDFDNDLDGLALAAFSDALDAPYPVLFSKTPNSGLQTSLDLDGDGQFGTARDAQGYGRFAGDGGVAVLSRLALDERAMQDYTEWLWRDLPGAIGPVVGGEPFPSTQAWDAQRLSSTVHWRLPVSISSDITVDLLIYAATPPVFDGPEDRNGLRSRDELRLWENLLDGAIGPSPDSFILVGKTNLDPQAGEGDQTAMRQFLNRRNVIDPHPGQPTADWSTDLRVSYVLPSRDWTVVDAGVLWPDRARAQFGLAATVIEAAGPHRLVWVDLTR